MILLLYCIRVPPAANTGLRKRQPGSSAAGHADWNWSAGMLEVAFGGPRWVADPTGPIGSTNGWGSPDVPTGASRRETTGRFRGTA